MFQIIYKLFVGHEQNRTLTNSLVRHCNLVNISAIPQFLQLANTLLLMSKSLVNSFNLDRTAFDCKLHFFSKATDRADITEIESMSKSLIQFKS